MDNINNNNFGFVKKISNLSLSRGSSKSSLIDSLKIFPSFLSCFIYSLSETNLYIYLDDIKNLILEFVKKDEKYNVLYLLNQSFEAIKNNNIIIFKQLIEEIQKIYDKIDKEKYNSLSIANVNGDEIIFPNYEILRKIFNDVLLIRSIIPTTSNLSKDEPKYMTYSTEDEVINAINEILEKEPKKIIEIYDLFFFKNIIKVSDNEFKIKFKYGFHFLIEGIVKDKNLSNEITLNDCFDYFYKETKIYLPA